MLKITSFSALIVGLLLAAPMVFTDAEAGRSTDVAVSAKSDRESTDQQLNNRLAAAFQLVDVCSRGATGDAGSWCNARHAELSDAGTAKVSMNTVTVESRDEARQTSTFAAIPTDGQ